MNDTPKNPHRRRFLKSLLSLGGAVETGREVSARPQGKTAFFWCDLKSGNIGFPTGLNVPSSRPGSVMKLVTAAALLEEGIFNPNQTLDCTGSFRTEREVYKCPRGHGPLSIEQAIACSCNVFFARATHTVGAGVILHYARLFGLDRGVAGSSFSFPREIPLDSVRLALGLDPDLKPSALQLMRIAALIGRRGRIPFLKSAEVVAGPDDRAFELDLKEDTFRQLKNAMIMAAREGTAKELDPEDRLKLAVKTGTVAHGKKFESFIVGFFPAGSSPADREPDHAFCLHAPAGTSHDAAVPQARRMLFSVNWP